MEQSGSDSIVLKCFCPLCGKETRPTSFSTTETIEREKVRSWGGRIVALTRGVLTRNKVLNAECFDCGSIATTVTQEVRFEGDVPE